MSNKTGGLQPGFLIFLGVVVLVGLFFGFRALSSNGMLGKMTSAIIPSKTTQAAAAGIDVKPVKFNGQKPLIVALNTWSGFAPGVYANGGFEPNAESRFIKDYGVAVQFIKMDNFDDSRYAWKTGKVDVICNTADVLPTELPNFMELKPKVFIQIDWSRGGDKIVVRPGINTVADLRKASIALALSSPSQTLVITAIESGEVTWDEIKGNIKKMPTAMEAAAAFKAGQVDAAVVWSPDDEDCLAAIPGSKVLISTKEAAFAIADIFYTKEETIRNRNKEITAFAAGWLKAAAELNTSAEARAKATKLMAYCFNVPEAVVNLDNARFCTYGDNVNFFNLSPTTCKCVKGEDLYTKMAIAFSKIGLAPSNVPSWRDVTDINILQSISGSFTGPENDAEGNVTFKKATAAEISAPAVATKRITINFETGVYKLSDEAKYIIDMDFAKGTARSMAGYRVRIEGNTDDVGSVQSNMLLSRKRAQAVADYLITTYEFDPNRFIIIGNGPNKPIASNDTPEGKAENRRTDFELVQAK